MKPSSMPTGTQIAYYHLCHRKLWLLMHQVRLEHRSDTVTEGKLLSETAYNRRAKRWRELDLGFVKIDHFDPQTRIVREVKKTPKLEHAHVAQLQYYLYVLEQAGTQDPEGLLEYPKQKKTKTVRLSDSIRKDIKGWMAEIDRIGQQEVCPAFIQKTYCRNCAYWEFCAI